MIKLVENSIALSEFPGEISLALNLSLCPNHCPGCSEAYLAEDIGVELTEELLDKLILENSGITLVGFMGGDNDHNRLLELAKYVKEKGLKVGFYSGRDELDLNLIGAIDYYKIGRFIKPEGDPSKWSKQTCGPISFPFSNQVMFKRVGDKYVNITTEFRKDPIFNLERYVL